MSRIARVFTIAKPYLFIAPAMAFLIVFTVYPIVHTLFYGFFEWGVLSPDPTFVGLNNYREAMASPIFRKDWGNTLTYSVATVVSTVALGLILALVANNEH